MAGAWGWSAAYGLFAAAMIVGLAASLCARESAAPTVRRLPVSLSEMRRVVTEPLAAFLRAFGPAAGLILLTVSAYELCDYVRGPVINPFYVAVGLSKSMVAWTRLTVGLPLSLLGTAAGGLCAARFGHMRALLAGAVLQPLAVAAFAALAYAGPARAIFATLMAFDDFSMSFAGVVLIAYMSTLTNAKYTATQFALLTSASVWSGKLLKGFSGVWVQDLAKHLSLNLIGAYAAFFLLTAASCGGVALMLVLALAAWRPKPPPSDTGLDTVSHPNSFERA